MPRLLAVALAGCTSLAHAQSVEFRIVERTGRTTVTGPGTAQLDCAVQARVLASDHSFGLVEFGFDLHIVDEPERFGVLTRGVISNPDHTASSAFGVSNTIGLGGLASQYSALASTNPSFNGLINGSGGTFKHGPDQEIGLIAGKWSAQALLTTPGLDADGDSNPDTWPANNSGQLPGLGTSAPISPFVASSYLGRGNWVDVYRFRYTVTDLSPRTLVFRMEHATAGGASRLHYVSGTWEAWGAYSQPRSASDLSITVAPSAAGSCCDGSGACSIVLPGECSGAFGGLASCVPGGCVAPVICCDAQTGVCASLLPAACTGSITTGLACSPSPCPLAACCGINAYCYLVPLSECGIAQRAGTTCAPSPCGVPVPCCEPATGVCVLTIPSLCHGRVLQSMTCPSTPCVGPSTCCNFSTGMCSIVAPGLCAGSISSATSCSPSPCPFVPCCDAFGACTMAVATACAGTLGPSASCVPNSCPIFTACCDPALGTCSLATGTGCSGRLAAARSCTPNPCSSPSAAGIAVEFRIVERAGRTNVSGPADAELNFAVQARVVGGAPTASLGGFSFTIQLVGEPESAGTLARGLISNLDHTYTSAIGVSSSIGRGGIAVQYSYLAALSGTFNGVINMSSGTFANTPDQEIGLITGYGLPLSAPGVDDDGDGNPDTWPGNGSGGAPGAVTAPIDPIAATTYFGAGASWIDIYRFRYTVTNFAPRTLRAHLRDVAATTFSQLSHTDSWIMDRPINTGAFPADAAVGVGAAASGVCCDVASGSCTAFLPGACGGSFVPVAACTPNPCAPPGACCSETGVCTLAPSATCTRYWTAGSVCAPNPCASPGACCSIVPPNGYNVCTIKVQAACSGPWAASACTIDCGPQWGACCGPTQVCVVVYDNNCASAWAPHTTCETSCAPLGRCCDNGACTVIPVNTCPTHVGAGALVGGSCSPNPCPPGGRCCEYGGACGIAEENWCYGAWTLGETCSPNPCSPAGRCCSDAGDCTFVVQSRCGSVWTFGATCEFSCPQPGRCCTTTGGCSLVLESACPDTWNPGLTCSGQPCAAQGACCRAGACAMTSAAACAATDGRMFHGLGTVCGSATNPIACCPANFNHVDGLSFADLFDFLAAWFAHDPAADFDGINSLEVADIFAFLNAWFVGCS